MRLLLDQNVPEKYRSAFEGADGITVSTVREELRQDASDTQIAVFAEQDGWVVFTNDSDFFSEAGDFGRLFYSQLEDPTPGDVVQALQAIAYAYDDDSEIVEKVPNRWI